jgi:hypothetical protein
MKPVVDKPPRFPHKAKVRSVLDPSYGYVVIAWVEYENAQAYLVRDPSGGEEIRFEGELEEGERQRDPVTSED